MLDRLTRRKDKFPCRIKECTAEKWIDNHNGDSAGCCDDCPFMAIVNKLAEYEDYEETTEDDWR